MKKMIIGIGVLGVFIVVFSVVSYHKPQAAPVVLPQPIAVTAPSATTSATIGSPKDTTYLIENTPVTLVAGTASTPTTPGSVSTNETNYYGNEVSIDLNHDGRMDTVFLLTQSTGGTGVFYYVVAALNLPDGYHGSEGIRLGDRIAPQSTTVDGALIVINYADRKQGEPFSIAPHVDKVLSLTFDAATMKFSIISSAKIVSASTTAPKLSGKKWVWVRTNYTDGRVFVPKNTTAFSLTFGTDAKVSGTTDCNTLGGSYTAGTTTLVFGRTVMTMKYCDGSEEGVFGDLLGQVALYSFTSTGVLELGLKKGSGTMIFN